MDGTKSTKKSMELAIQETCIGIEEYISSIAPTQVNLDQMSLELTEKLSALENDLKESENFLDFYFVNYIRSLIVQYYRVATQMGELTKTLYSFGEREVFPLAQPSPEDSAPEGTQVDDLSKSEPEPTQPHSDAVHQEAGEQVFAEDSIDRQDITQGPDQEDDSPFDSSPSADTLTPAEPESDAQAPIADVKPTDAQKPAMDEPVQEPPKPFFDETLEETPETVHQETSQESPQPVFDETLEETPETVQQETSQESPQPVFDEPVENGPQVEQEVTAQESPHPFADEVAPELQSPNEYISETEEPAQSERQESAQSTQEAAKEVPEETAPVDEVELIEVDGIVDFSPEAFGAADTSADMTDNETDQPAQLAVPEMTIDPAQMHHERIQEKDVSQDESPDESLDNGEAFIFDSKEREKEDAARQGLFDTDIADISQIDSQNIDLDKDDTQKAPPPEQKKQDDTAEQKKNSKKQEGIISGDDLIEKMDSFFNFE